jgi:hypothetical protein
MRYLLSGLLIGCLFAISPAAPAASTQDPTIGVSLIELISNPEKFDKKTVEVTAFLVIEHQQRHAPQATLWLHQEDARNLLPNGIGVIPSESMLRDEEKINDMYVRLRGKFLATPTVGGGFALEIKDVQNCVPWSKPDRPIGTSRGSSGN